MARAPAPRPCVSCPYRQDVPSGVWAAEEYLKLPDYDRPTGEQPVGLFHCHQQDGRVCAGWAAVHDMDENLALRFAASTGTLSPEDAVATRDYETDVPLWPSGLAAAEHGLRAIRRPGKAARQMIERLERKARRGP